MDYTSYNTDSNLLAQKLTLEKDLELERRFIDNLEQELQDANRRQEDTEAAASKAQCDARTCKEQLNKTEKRHHYEMQSVVADLDKTVAAGVEMKRKVHVLLEAKDAAKPKIENLKLQVQQDSEQYEANKRSLEMKAHVAEGRLKTMREEVERADVQRVYEADVPRMTYEQPHSQEVGDASPSSNSGTIESLTASPATRNPRTLDVELKFWDTDEEQVEMGYSDTDTAMEYWKGHIEASRFCDKGTQADPDDQPNEEQDSPVKSVGLDIMDKLDELASICADLGMKSVKIYRSADWIVVLFP